MALAGFLIFGSCFFGYFADSEVEHWDSAQSKMEKVELARTETIAKIKNGFSKVKMGGY